MEVYARTHVTVTIPHTWGGEITLQPDPATAHSVPSMPLCISAEDARLLSAALIEAADKVGRHAALEEDE